LLSHSQIKTAESRAKPYELFDNGGLFRLVQPTGHRGWRFRYRINGHEKLLSFGPYPTVSLAKARLKLKRAKALLLDGIDPSLKRKAEKHAGADSFEAVVRVVRQPQVPLGQQLPRPHHSTLRARHLSVDRQQSNQENLAGRNSYLFETHRIPRHARNRAPRLSKHLLGIPPCRGNGPLIHDPSAPLKGSLLPTNEKQLASITDPKQLGELLRAIDAYAGSHTVHTALRLAPLVFVPPTELRAAEWSEISLSIQEWLIPAHRMKMRVPHIVPLSTPAAAVQEHSTRRRRRQVCFPESAQQGTLTVHGVSTTASTLSNEQGWRPAAIERQLAHSERDHVRAVYNHADYLAERKLMMQEWADYLDELRSRG
jgi:integrase